jgi:CheY-like chemotaxis protein
MAGILIVDDDATIRAMFARALSSLGEVEQAANGADALRLLGTKRYGIVLLDLHMPVIDGFIILQTLSTKPGPNRDTAIYVITADTSEQARIRALRRHAVFLLTKPVPLATLTALVDSALKKAATRPATPAAEHDDAPPLPTPEKPLDRKTPPVRPVTPAAPSRDGAASGSKPRAPSEPKKP